MRRFQHRLAADRAQTLAVDDAHAAQSAAPALRDEFRGGERGLLRVQPVQVEVILDHPVRAAQLAQDVAWQPGTQVARVVFDFDIVIKT